MVGHITPEAYIGGLLSLVEDGDPIEIDISKHQLNLLVDEKTLAARRSQQKPLVPRATSGVLYKYAKHVKTAADGCVTDED